MTSQSSPQPHPPPTPWQPQPRANIAVGSPYNASNWLLNSGATHRITSDIPVRDLSMGALLLQGRTKDELYEWPVSPSQATTMFASSTAKSSAAWHSRLGHPSPPILNSITSKFSLPVSSSSSSKTLFCSNCHINKNHKLPFSDSSIVSSRPLHYLFTDVWTSPITSIDNYKYYIILVDHYTRYSWLYPLKHKSQVKETSIAFKALVENHFKSRIDTLYSDNGGDFIALRSFLASHGISHLTTPPHTPEHNGLSERKHRHVVETGLTLMSEASLPKHYWPYAFAADVYLINRFPTPVLNNVSPYTRLFGTSPNYGKLRVFGCLCFPWLRPYTAHKLDTRSQPCVFLGYSLTQSPYLCLDPETERVYVSRHVQFDEITFPFRTNQSSTETLLVVDQLTTTSPSVLRLPLPEKVHPCYVPHTTPPPPPKPSVSFPPSSQVLPSNPQTQSTAPHEPQNQNSIAPHEPLNNHSPPPHLSPPQPTQDITTSQTSSTEITSPSSSRSSSPLPQPSPPTSPPPPPPAPLPELIPQPEPDHPDDPMNTHQMRTRSKNNITKPSKKYSLLSALKNPLPFEPTTITQALKDPNWGRAVSVLSPMNITDDRICVWVI
ncbi:unnamed protein product [Microthlaspi erraticum]|uniref:Integrase catalytic domain-containing protein n=1 Tax=Microthlaspi erraticum TaxID=1685480 RepID=A0A6D2HFS1_9BRAS|nr:unnamed protein product [Microthlaspi erraticum]